MTISVSCTECGKRYTVKEEAAGKRFECKECGGAIVVPRPAVRSAADDYDDERDDYDDRPTRKRSQKRSSTGDGYPVNLQIEYPERSSRMLALCSLLMLPRMLMLFPHVLVLVLMNFIISIVAFVAYIVVLFTGRYPRGMFDLVVGQLRWAMRVQAWWLGLADRYPPFSAKE